MCSPQSHAGGRAAFRDRASTNAPAEIRHTLSGCDPIGALLPVATRAVAVARGLALPPANLLDASGVCLPRLERGSSRASSEGSGGREGLELKYLHPTPPPHPS